MKAEAPSELLTTVRPLRDQPSMEERVVRELRTLIVAGELQAGTPLRQRTLALSLGISPTPVRAGLIRLANEGLVATSANGRTVVSALTREDMQELYAMRLGVEGLAARLGAEAVSAAAVVDMTTMFARFEPLASRRDVARYLEARWEFHAIPYRAACRPRLLRRVERLFWQAERYNTLLLSTPARFERSVANYRAFLDACRTNDGVQAEAAMHEAVQWGVDELIPELPSEAVAD